MDGNEYMRKTFANNLNSLNCCMVGRILSIDKTRSSVEVQPLHRVFIEDELTTLTPIQNVPLFQFMSSDYIVKVPINVNDIVLLVFADYDIQNLVLTGELREVNTNDIHALDDAIAIPMGLNPFNNNLNVNNNDDLIIGKKDSTMFIKINDDGIELNSGPNNINLNTTGQGNVNIDCYDFDVTERMP